MLDEETPTEMIYRTLRDHILFNHKGLSKKIDLEYEVKSAQPWVYFQCPSDDGLSFRVHDLELGEKEALFWHMFAQNDGKAMFEGFINPLYFLGLKTIRGYIINHDLYHKIGIIARNGRVQKIKTHEEIIKDSFQFSSLVTFFIKSRTPDTSENKTEQQL